jgi:hypothetical protein
MQSSMATAAMYTAPRPELVCAAHVALCPACTAACLAQGRLSEPLSPLDWADVGEIEARLRALWRETRFPLPLRPDGQVRTPWSGGGVVLNAALIVV